MTIAPLTLRTDYWENFDYQEKDLDFLYNLLLENETPKTPQELVREVVRERIRTEKLTLQNQNQPTGKIFIPKDQYEVGQTLLFPALDWKPGKVVGIRDGLNPELPSFDVIDVLFADGTRKEFASKVSEHVLNQPISVKLDDPNLDVEHVITHFGAVMTHKLTEELESNPDLVRIAGRWFPRALLVDVNIGYLNLAEALLDMEGGGPLSTRAILEQIELPTDVNLKLTEFSLNLALQEDGRFDEVGPAGEVLWFLKRLEPDGVQNLPVFLKYNAVNYDADLISAISPELEDQVWDELVDRDPDSELSSEKVTVSLIFPHWRAGTLPLVKGLKKIFPTALESPRVQFTFIDGDTGASFPGWVNLTNHYVYGLRDWYVNNNIIPGSILNIKKSKKAGEVIIQFDRRRATRDWLRTALVGADGGVVFAMLKQMVSTTYDDRMVVAVPDFESLDTIWQSPKSRATFENIVMSMMRELTKLSPQGHVHAQELYAAVNLVRRCPPGPILSLLADRSWATHLGDLYFRYNDNESQGDGSYA
jgi:hypothetical protein